MDCKTYFAASAGLFAPMGRPTVNRGLFAPMGRSYGKPIGGEVKRLACQG